MKLKVKGILPAMLTPFTRGGAKVDYDKAAEFAEYLVKKGADGLFVCGTTGEGQLLSVEERKNIAKLAVDTVGKRASIVVQTGFIDTATTIELTRHAESIGASAASVCAPFFYGYDEEALLQHYRKVAQSAPALPILLYNIPSCTHNPISVDLAIRLGERVKNIVGMKDSGGAIQYLKDVIRLAPKDFAVFNGTDEYAIAAYTCGAAGAVSGPSNVVPELQLGIFAAVQKGDMKKARRLQDQLDSWCGVLKYGRMLAYFKEALRVQGMDLGAVRPPQRELTQKEKKDFRTTCERMMR